MAAHANTKRRTSYAGSEPALSRDIPASLHKLQALRPPFDHARDPFISAQLKAMRKTEAQRWEESGRGSSMVRQHRPFPELRPKHESGPLRASFNQAWLKEQRDAQLAHYRQERENTRLALEYELNEPCKILSRER